MRARFHFLIQRSHLVCLLALFAIYTYEIITSGIHSGKAIQLLLCTLVVMGLEKSIVKQNWLIKHGNILLILASPLFIMFAVFGQWISKWEYFLYTYCIVLFSYLVICAFVGQIRTAIYINVSAYALLLIVNDTVMQFRKNFFFPADILSLKTALSVGTAYMGSYRASYSVIAALIAVYVFFLFLHNFCPKSSVRPLAVRSISIALSAILLFSMPTPNDYISGEFRTAQKVERYGYISVFSLELQALHHLPPDGYDSELAEIALTDPVHQDAPSNSPNIIVILDESFCDYTLIGNLHTNQDYMPFIRQLQNECQSGIVYVPSWSGKTCNTEWEILTGNSIAFYPGAVPYTQLISSSKFSLASHMSELNYSTTAIHPYYATGYRRDEVYPMLGFDEFYFIEDFDSRYINMEFHTRPENTELADNDNLHIRDMISDAASFKKIIECFETNKGNGEKSFIFNLTMQNHAPYTYSNFATNIYADIPINHPDKIEIDQYLSLLSETDKAFQELIAYFSHVEDDTIILFMGDHQPGMGNEFYNEIYGHEWDFENWSFQENLQRYAIPYVLWANFDYENSHDYSVLSSNYIPLMLLDAAELDQGNWYTLLHELYENYPVINNAGILDSNENWISYSQQYINEDDLLSQYQKIQYYRMFDE